MTIQKAKEIENISMELSSIQIHLESLKKEKIGALSALHSIDSKEHAKIKVQADARAFGIIKKKEQELIKRLADL